MSDGSTTAGDPSFLNKVIPKPDNITVTLFSWTPPSVRVGWDFIDPFAVQPPPTLFPGYQPSTTTRVPEASSGEEGHQLEAFRIIYHPTVTK